MSQYYVIRDKDTGLYFRGKGVNRWGKHYNQASIYRIKKNAENTIKEVSWRGERAEIVPIQIVETTADVVEAVRCKDCKHYDDGICQLHSEEPDQYGGGFNMDMLENDFCSYGERSMK